MEFFNLRGKVALVTGGNGGIGLAYAKGLIKAGARVAIWGRNSSKNDSAIQVLKELGGDAASFICDITDSSQVDTVFKATMAHFGQVDICFANAGGGGPRGMLHQLGDEDWKGILDLNLNSVVYSYQKVIAQLIERKSSWETDSYFLHCRINWDGFCHWLFHNKSSCLGTYKGTSS